MAQLHELFTNQDEKRDLAYPVFYIKTVEDERSTQREGKVKFVEQEYVTIKTFDKTMEFDGPVEDRHRKRWPSHYKAFKEGQDLPVEGTPIQHWPVISELRRRELNSIGIRTVEDLADFPDGDMPPRSDFHNLKRLARDWLKESKGLGVIGTLRDELKQTKSENESLKETLEKLQSKVSVLEEMVDKPKRGRPRKKE